MNRLDKLLPVYEAFSKKGKQYIGYKVMSASGQSGANANLKLKLTKGKTISMPGNGIYLSNSKQYVLDYYSGLADNEVLLTLMFDKNDIMVGESAFDDKEPEIGVSHATILKVEKV